MDLLADMGAYLMLVTPGVPLLGAFMYNAIYKMDAYSFKCTGVFTTKVPTDAYRGAGRPEATFAIEHIMDELAAELGMDPLELRERNWIKHEEFPFTTIATLTYDTGNYEAATAKAIELFGYDELRKEQAARRPLAIRSSSASASPPTPRCAGWRRRGSSARSPTARAAGSTPRSGCCPPARSRWSPGRARTARATRPRGARSWPTSSACRSRTSGCCTATPQVSPKGMDTYGSRSLAVGGIAVVGACDKVIAKAKVIAAGLLEVSADDLEWTPGRWSVRGDPEKGRDIAEIALATFAAHNLPDGVEPSLDSDATYDPDNFSFPHGTHLCAVEVDTETGQVKIRSYVAVDDVGVVVNPLIVEGQVHGGIAQGIAQALYEEAAYDADGNLLTTTLADYLLPSAADLPTFVTDRTRDPGDDQPARGQGRRRGRHDRVHARRGQRGHRRAAAARRHGRRDAVHPAAGLAGHQRGQGRRAMIPAKFDYVRPASLAEAVQALAGGGEDAKVIAGGQSLLPLLRLRLAYPDLLVDLGGLGELRGVRDDGDALVIGAITTHDSLIRDPLIREHCGLIAAGGGDGGRPAVRHRGTIGGSLSHADPAGDLPAVMAALDATMFATGPGGERAIAAADFFVDYLTTALTPGEILTAIRVPKLGPGWGYRYEKFHPTAQAWAIVGVAALARRYNGHVAEARIGLTNMGTVPVRAHAAEAAAAGAEATREALAAAGRHADEGTDPPATCAPRPTTGATWPGFSPAGPWRGPPGSGKAGDARPGRGCPAGTGFSARRVARGHRRWAFADAGRYRA